MKDMIKRIREEREGFTLAELLIVVAIIAVLVAIAIPVFNSQLEKSREAVDLSNIRAAYAECSSAVLTGETTGTNDGVSQTAAKDGYQKTVTLEQTKEKWEGDNANAKIAGKSIADLGLSSINPTATPSLTVKVSNDGALTITPNNA